MYHWIACLLLSLCLGACAQAPYAEVDPQSHPLNFNQLIMIDQVPLYVAVMDMPEKRTTGLMHVDYLSANEGALFIFDQQEDVVFWMKNTLIPLDMLFFDANGELVHLIHSVQPCEQEQCDEFVVKNCKYAVEVSAGFIKRHQLSYRSSLQLNSLPDLSSLLAEKNNRW